MLMLMAFTGCTEFALLASGSSIAISQIMKTEKSIKKHAYEKGKKYLVDYTKAKALGIMNKH